MVFQSKRFVSRQFMRTIGTLRDTLRRKEHHKIDFGAGYGNHQPLLGGGISSGYDGNLASAAWTTKMQPRGTGKNFYFVIDDGALGGHVRLTEPDNYHLFNVKKYPQGEHIRVIDITRRAVGVADYSTVAASLMARANEDANCVIHQLDIRGNILLIESIRVKLEVLVKTVKTSLNSFPF